MLKLKEVSKIYGDGIKALDEVDVEIKEGEFVVILGPSGAGKSTLLRCINRLIEPTYGRIYLNGEEITSLCGRKLHKMRQKIGMIFQQFNLVKRLSVLQNVLSGRLGDVSTLRSLFYSFPKKDVQLALECLDRVGLKSYAAKRADTLSGGQQQRVAIARALAQRPKVILADEPMASLDPRTAKVIMDLLKKINREEKIIVIVNLHVVELAKEYADRIIGLTKGKVVFDGIPSLLDKHFKTIYYEEETRVVNADMIPVSSKAKRVWVLEAGKIAYARWQIGEGGDSVENQKSNVKNEEKEN
ncbi:MAG: phosphonate ABC transporter ATP-binding protein [Candidatus Omnitrophica bacterium]|nr:phosphonate ABC transporter ATP-binding protein [Candidatus Omnitrophota bacterium]